MRANFLAPTAPGGAQPNMPQSLQISMIWPPFQQHESWDVSGTTISRIQSTHPNSIGSGMPFALMIHRCNIKSADLFQSVEHVRVEPAIPACPAKPAKPDQAGQPARPTGHRCLRPPGIDVINSSLSGLQPASYGRHRRAAFWHPQHPGGSQACHKLFKYR